MIQLPRLYAVADGTYGDPVRLSLELFKGGARLIQIRHKSVASQVLLDEVDEAIKAIPRSTQIIVNDRPDVAMLTGAFGVHLGQEDLQPSLARMALNDGQVVGYSTHSLSQAIHADRAPVDYIAAGPVFPTSTKAGAAPVLGLETLRKICSMVHKPVVAIGGITLDTVNDVFDCGAVSVAVIGDLLRHQNVADRTRIWVRQLES